MIWRCREFWMAIFPSFTSCFRIYKSCLPSLESIIRRNEQVRRRKRWSPNQLILAKQIQFDLSAFDIPTSESLPSADNYVGSGNAESPKTPPQKRVISGSSDTSSFNIPSTNTTPTKVEKPESETQSLQNTLINSLIRVVWRGSLRVDWVRNRKMWLKYVAYIPCTTFTD